MNYLKEFLKYFVLGLCVVGFLVAMYFEINDPNAYREILLTVVVVDLPLFAVLELFYLRYQTIKADNSYEVNALRLEMIRILQWIEANDCAATFFNRLISDGEAEKAHYINVVLQDYGIRVDSIAEAKSLLLRGKEIIRKANSKAAKKRLLALFKNIRQFDSKALAAPFIKRYNDYLCGSLAFARHETKLNLFAFSFTVLSVSIALFSLLQLPFGWPTFVHIGCPILIEGLSFVFGGYNEAFWQKRILTLQNAALSKTKKRLEQGR